MIFAAVMVYGVIENIKRNTSEPAKRRGVIKRQHRTWSQVLDVIFGEKRAWYDYFLPTAPVYSTNPKQD